MPFIYESDQRQREQLAPEPIQYQKPASFGETYTTAFQYAMDEETSISSVLNRQGFRQREDEINRLVDEGIIDRSNYTNRRGRLDYDRLATEFESIKSTATLSEERREFLRKRREEAQDVFDRGSGLAQFLGMASAFVVDPVNLMTLPVSSVGTAARGLTWVGRGLLTARREAALSAATELAIQPLVYQHKKEIDSPYSYQQAIANVALAAGGSAGIGFVSGGIAGYFKAVRDRAEPELTDATSQMAFRSLRENEDYLNSLKIESPSRIVEEEYGKFVSGNYTSTGEVRSNIDSRISNAIKDLQDRQTSIVRFIAEQGGLNEKAWKDAGLDVSVFARNPEVRQQLPKNKPLTRKKDKGLTPETFVQRASELGLVPDGSITPARALDIVNIAARNPEAIIDPSAVTRAQELESLRSQLKDQSDDDLQRLYKESQKAEIEIDKQRLAEKEINRRQMNEPSKKYENYVQPKRQKVAAQTANERQREVIERTGDAEDYDLAIEEYERIETKQMWDAEQNQFVDADQLMKELDDEIEGIDEILRCTVDA